MSSYLTLKELSQYWNVKESWLRQQVFRKKIPVIRIGRLLRFNRSIVENWLQKSQLEGEV